MNQPKITIVTTFPNAAIAAQIGTEAMQARLQVAVRAAKADLDAGYNLVALCEPEMLKYFDTLTGDIVILTDPDSTKTTMGQGRRRVIEHAVDEGAEIIMWREPEKNLASFVPELIKPITEGAADIVIPRRKSLDSYPKFSQFWERTGSLIASAIIGGEPQDYWVGPRIFEATFASYFLEYPGEQASLPDGHDCIFGPLVHAALGEANIAGVEIDFKYPAAQRKAEENDIPTILKRMAVMEKITQAMLDRKNWLLAQMYTHH